jgi:hypothetical protein
MLTRARIKLNKKLCLSFSMSLINPISKRKLVVNAAIAGKITSPTLVNGIIIVPNTKLMEKLKTPPSWNNSTLAPRPQLAPIAIATALGMSPLTKMIELSGQ